MRTFLVVSVAGLALAGCSYSSYGPSDNRSHERSGVFATGDIDATGNVEYSGMVVDAGGNIGRDLHLSGASVNSDAHIGGDLEIEGARIRFSGSVAGNAQVTGATMRLEGRFANDLEVTGARADIRGTVDGRFWAHAARVELDGIFNGPVIVTGAGNDEHNGRVTIDGHLAQGADICASRVSFRRNARVDGPMVIIADERPDWDGEFEFEPLNGRDCERLRRG